MCLEWFAGDSTPAADWADLLRPDPRIPTMQQSESITTFSARQEQLPSKQTSRDARERVPSGQAPDVDKSPQQNRKMADIFSILLNTE